MRYDLTNAWARQVVRRHSGSRLRIFKEPRNMRNTRTNKTFRISRISRFHGSLLRRRRVGIASCASGASELNFLSK